MPTPVTLATFISCVTVASISDDVNLLPSSRIMVRGAKGCCAVADKNPSKMTMAARVFERIILPPSRTLTPCPSMEAYTRADSKMFDNCVGFEDRQQNQIGQLLTSRAAAFSFSTET